MEKKTLLNAFCIAVLAFLLAGLGSYVAPTAVAGATNFFQGNAAHNAADSGNPIKIGGKVSTGIPTSLANGQRTDAYFDANGRLVVALGTQIDATNDNVSIGASATVVGPVQYRNTALTNSAQSVKVTAGNVYGYTVENTNSSTIWIQIYDTTSAVTPGTTTPTYSIPIPANSVVHEFVPWPLTCSNAIKICVTTTMGGGTAPTNAMAGTFYYK